MDEIEIDGDHTCFHGTVGIRKMKKSPGRTSLEKRMENEKSLKKIVQIITFGLGMMSMTVLESGGLLLERDYPILFDFIRGKRGDLA